MSLLTILSSRISRNYLRMARKNAILVNPTALTHSKTESGASSLDNEQTIKTVTRKKYTELPSLKKHPDGSSAVALDEWPGGLEMPLKTVLAQDRSGSRPGIILVPEDKSREPPRKRRKTLSAQCTDDLPLPRKTMLSSASLHFWSKEFFTQLGQEEQARDRQKSVVGTKDSRTRNENKCDITSTVNDNVESRARGRPKSVVTSEDSQIQGSQEYAEEMPLLIDVQAVSNSLPVKIQRKLKKAAKSSRSPLELETSGNADTLSRGLIRTKVSRRKRAQGNSGIGSITSSGERRMPQNQLATEILENLAKFPHCILLTRVGNFYESYFDQAAEVAQLLSIKLTKRTWDRQEVLMCGFPIVHLDKHLKVLVQTHKRCVAMCEEFKRTNSEEGFDRRVVRVLTPGTLIDEPFLNPYENNYLLAVGILPRTFKDDGSGSDFREPNLIPPQECLGLAWIDVSTGEFFSQESTLTGLKDDLARIGPREVVLHASFRDQLSHPIHIAASDEGSFVSYISPQDVPSSPAQIDMMSSASNEDGPMIVSSFSQSYPITPVFTDHESSAISLLTAFLQANLLDHMPMLSAPARQGQQDRMQIDSHTIKALEIREGMREGGVTGSLMSVVKRTVTTGGTRLLSRWLCSPSISVPEIRTRQNLVALFCSRRHLRDDLTLLLKQIEDASRIVQRFLLGKGDVADLSAIKNAIEIWGEIKSRVEMESQMEAQTATLSAQGEWSELDGLLRRMADLRGLSQRIGMAVADKTGDSECAEDEGGPELLADIQSTFRGGVPTDKEWGSYKWTIRPNFSPELLSLHTRLKDAEAERQRLEEDLRRRYNAPSLTLRSSGNHGVHVHIGNSRRDVADIERSQYFIAIASTGSTKSFFSQTWYLLGTRIIETILQISAAERNAFDTLRREVNVEAGALRRNARIVDELDVTLGFSHLANEMNFVRPLLSESPSYLVTNGRHPSVELGLLTSGRVFTPNTVSLTPESRLHIITGPNMAGKSTLLRQTAILAVLAQTGSFVPADKAEMGIVDKMFSRVGAKDDLFRDKSTFMVEMLETAEILNRATERSLVIMDEVGRGTTVKDGLAIAFATVCHLYNVNRCRTLFATHFHEVADMLGYVEGSPPSGAFQNIGFFCTDVDETQDGHFTYSHRLRPGVNRDSHGLKVARLAGVPPSAMRIAHEALDWMKTKRQSWIADKEQLRVIGEAIITGKAG